MLFRPGRVGQIGRTQEFLNPSTTPPDEEPAEGLFPIGLSLGLSHMIISYPAGGTGGGGGGPPPDDSIFPIGMSRGLGMLQLSRTI